MKKEKETELRRKKEDKKGRTIRRTRIDERGDKGRKGR